MRVIVEESEEVENYFPGQLMIFLDNIVQVSSDQEGCAPGMFRGQNIKTGVMLDRYVKNNFKPFRGKVIFEQ